MQRRIRPAGDVMLALLGGARRAWLVLLFAMGTILAPWTIAAETIQTAPPDDDRTGLSQPGMVLPRSLQLELGKYINESAPRITGANGQPATLTRLPTPNESTDSEHAASNAASTAAAPEEFSLLVGDRLANRLPPVSSQAQQSTAPQQFPAQDAETNGWQPMERAARTLTQPLAATPPPVDSTIDSRDFSPDALRSLPGTESPNVPERLANSAALSKTAPMPALTPTPAPQRASRTRVAANNRPPAKLSPSMSAWDSLLQPIVMRQDESYEPPATNQAAAAPQQRSPEPAEPKPSVHDLLLPFLATNNTAASKSTTPGSKRSTDNTTSSGSNSTGEFAALSALWRQLNLTNEVPGSKSSIASENSTHQPENRGWASPVSGLMQPLTIAKNGSLIESQIDEDLGESIAAYLQPDIQEQIIGDEMLEELPPGAFDEEGGTLSDAETLGREPVDNSLQFLRTTTVLLDPGDAQIDIGLTYLVSDFEFPILLVSGSTIVGVDDAQFKIRQLQMPLEVRFGLTKRIQAFVGAPIGWANAQLTFDSFEAYENDGGFGDTAAGVTIQWRDENECQPAFITTLGFTAPTGQNPYTTAVGLAPSGPSLGAGFWSFWASALWIRTYDPLVFFYGLGGRAYADRTYTGRLIEPGAEFNYTFGVGFAVNSRVTLSSRFFGAYTEEIKVDGQRIEGTNLEPMTMRFAATILKSNRLVEPFVEFGLTKSAVSSHIGVIWTF